MRYLIALCLLALALTPSSLLAQEPIPVETGQPISMLSPDQLDGLVAPIALYPDPLISQVLVASEYPLQIVQAWQWLQQNPGLSGPALAQAAQAQNWDPSVQALVMFPDVLRHLNEDINWTRSLGDAFMNQQADVMGAVQRMRMSAEQSGRLASTPQQQVINTTNAGQPVVEIEPANPEVIYVPTYNPAWVWGPAVYYPYPRWYYPAYRPGIFFNFGISVGAFFGPGWGGWGAWGWRPAWGSRTVVVNNTFIRRYNSNSTRFANVARPYAGRGWNNQYRGNFNSFASSRSNVYAPPRVNSYAQARANTYVAPRMNTYVAPRMNTYAPRRTNSFASPQMSRPAFSQSYSRPSYSRPSMSMGHAQQGGFSGGSRGGAGRGRGRR